MFGIKGRDTFNKPASDMNHIMLVVRKWGAKLFPYILGVLVIVIVGIIGYVWYTYLHTKDVTSAEEKEYIDTKNKEVTFKKEKFDDLKNTVILRQENFDAERSTHKDIFYEKEYEENQVTEELDPQEELEERPVEVRQE